MMRRIVFWGRIFIVSTFTTLVFWNLLFLNKVWAEDHIQDDVSLMPLAWSALEDGEVETAFEIAVASWKTARIEAERDSAMHLMTQASCLKGKYEEAIDYQSMISDTYPRDLILNRAVMNSYVPLGRYQEALDYALTFDMTEGEIADLRSRLENPLRVAISSVNAIPFETGEPLSPYMPGFQIEINGKKTVVQIDTGATFLVMSPEAAEGFGIDVVCAGSGFLGRQPTATCFGHAKSVRFGNIVLTNVPVLTVDVMKKESLPMAGANLFQPFLTTIDYPNERLIISPRGDRDMTARHMGLLSPVRHKVPFYLWDDHFMISRGALTHQPNLNFVLDTGLVATDYLDRIFALWVSKEALYEWGFIDTPCENYRLIEPGEDIYLGSDLCQSGHVLLETLEQKRDIYGGIRIDAFLTGAFLNAYSWTMDFDSMAHYFGNP